MMIIKKNSFLLKKKVINYMLIFKRKKNIFLRKYFIKNGISFLLNLNMNILFKYLYEINLLKKKVISIYLNKKEKLLNLKKLKSYKGIRLIRKLPINGQRTKSNAKTRKKRNIL